MTLKKNNTGRKAPARISSLRQKDLVVWIDRKDAQHVRVAGPPLLNEPIQQAKRVRVGHQYKAQRNFHGLYWFGQTGEHVWYESLFEMTALMSLDFFHDIHSISSQPMMMQFAGGKLHFPDLFATHADGRQIVYDVRPRELVDDAATTQFAETKRVCDTVGWGYELFTSIDPIAKNNLEWLAGYRHPRHVPKVQVRNRVLAAAESAMPLADLARVVHPDHPALGTMALYNMLWNRSLAFDMTLPLSNFTLISKDNFHDRN